MHTCPMATPGTPPVPHVGGPIVTGFPQVMIGAMPASRVSDTAICVGPPDVIVKGSPTVPVGAMMAARLGDHTAHGGVIVMGFPQVMIGGAIVYQGTLAAQGQAFWMVQKMAASGPSGQAFASSLQDATTPTRVHIGTTATRADGTVINLAATGGGVTLRPSQSQTGDNEVHFNPNHLIDYTATDGSIVRETPEGLLLHEMGHAALLNAGDPAQTTGGPAAEANVRALTNPVRREMGMQPEAP
jgi:uncharacterized Zn-binding protein involved in type VI secretion